MMKMNSIYPIAFLLLQLPGFLAGQSAFAQENLDEEFLRETVFYDDAEDY